MAVEGLCSALLTHLHRIKDEIDEEAQRELDGEKQAKTHRQRARETESESESKRESEPKATRNKR